MRVRLAHANPTLMIGLGLVAAACGATAASSMPYPLTSVNVTTATLDRGPETILTDSRGFTLYLFTPEKDGAFACIGACLNSWHALLLPAGTDAASSAEALPGKLGVVVRPGGARQVTYNEWPLYTFVGDERPGDITGQGIANQWFVVKSVMSPDGDNDSDGTAVPSPSPSGAPRKSPAPRPTPNPAFNDNDGDNSGGSSDGDGNG